MIAKGQGGNRILYMPLSFSEVNSLGWGCDCSSDCDGAARVAFYFHLDSCSAMEFLTGFCYNSAFCHSAYHILHYGQLRISWGCGNGKQIGGRWTYAVTLNEIVPECLDSLTESSIGLAKDSVNAKGIVRTPSGTNRRRC
jgi:hypothetical protein